MEIKSPTIAVPWVLVKVVVDVKTVPDADVLKCITCDALVTVNPAVVLPQMNVNSIPLAALAGNVHDGLPLVEMLIRVDPDCAAVRTTVAPASALFVTTPVRPPLNTGTAVKVATPVTFRVLDAVTAPVRVVAPVTARVPPNAVFLLVLRPLSRMLGRLSSIRTVIIIRFLTNN